MGKREKIDFSMLSKLSAPQLAEFLGISRNTIFSWVRDYGMPRNFDKTFDLKLVI